MYNPYQGYFIPHTQPNVLPQQQVIQVNGKASVDTIQLAPNSSILVMDTSAPVVWLCVSDGVGKVTATPYDISLHQDAPPPNIAGFETRLSNVESILARMEAKNNESNGTKSKPKSNNTELSTN